MVIGRNGVRAIMVIAIASGALLMARRVVAEAPPLGATTIYDADPARNVFEGRALEKADEKGRPIGWSDVAAFDKGTATFGDHVLSIENKDAAGSVRVGAVVSVKPEWKYMTAAARVEERDLKFGDGADAGAGVRYLFLDKDQKGLGTAGYIVPLTKGAYQGWKYKAASFAVPDGAAFLSVNVGLTETTGTLRVSGVVIVPTDVEKEVAPAAVAALHRAIKRGNTATVKEMIAKDKRLLECRNADYDWGTPLIGAGWEGKEDVVTTLVTLGADLTAVDRNWGSGAAVWAGFWGRPAALGALLDVTHPDLKEVKGSIEEAEKRDHKGGAPEDYAACLELVKKAAAPTPATTRAGE